MIKWSLFNNKKMDKWVKAVNKMADNNSTHLNANSIVNHITTKISILSNIFIASSSYPSIVEKTLKAKHVNTMKNLKEKK